MSKLTISQEGYTRGNIKLNSDDGVNKRPISPPPPPKPKSGGGKKNSGD